MEGFSFADIDYDGGALDLVGRATEFDELGDKVDREIVYRIVVQVLEYPKDGAFAGAAEAGDDDELRPIFGLRFGFRHV